MTEARLTKRQKRVLRQNGEHELINNRPSFNSPNFNQKRVHPLTDNQKKTFDASTIEEYKNSDMYRQKQEIKRQQKERREQMLDEMYN